MCVAVDVAGAEDKASAKLKRIGAQLVLAVAALLRALAGNSVVFSQQVQDIGRLKARGLIRLALSVN